LFQDADGSRRAGGSTLERKTLRFPDRTWLLCLLICTLAAAVSFVYLDVPVAHRVYGIFGPGKGGLATGFASDVLLSVEAAVVLALVILRITHGHLSPFREASALACLTSICAYAINDSALKPLFGVPGPAAVMRGSHHAFHFLSGFSDCSFPSGHMILAGAFAGVFMRLYRRSVRPLSALLFVAAVLLVVGDWHFVSDIIAGTFLGVSAGLLGGEVWLVHSRWALQE
jgi:membrane-associated phospholipid phosphatase